MTSLIKYLKIQNTSLSFWRK